MKPILLKILLFDRKNDECFDSVQLFGCDEIKGCWETECRTQTRDINLVKVHRFKRVHFKLFLAFCLVFSFLLSFFRGIMPTVSRETMALNYTESPFQVRTAEPNGHVRMTLLLFAVELEAEVPAAEAEFAAVNPGAVVPWVLRPSLWDVLGPKTSQNMVRDFQDPFPRKTTAFPSI